MVYGYTRVSTRGQIENNSLEEQENTIRGKYPNAKIIKEAYSAAKKEDERKKFKRLVNSLVKDDTLVVTKLDRFCRNVREGLQVIEQLLDRDVCIHILNMGLIDNSAMGKLIVTVLLAFAEFERNMIVERTQTGKAIAKQSSDFREGRPRKYSKIQIEHSLSLLEQHTYKQVEKLTGISKSTLVRAKRRKKLENN
jgi:DNA invertase Pin-like site-specific DNA recombinase